MKALSWYFMFFSVIGIGYFVTKAMMGNIPLFDGGFGVAVILVLAWLLIGEVEEEVEDEC